MPEIEQPEACQTTYSRNHITSMSQTHVVGEPMFMVPGPKPRMTRRLIFFADLTGSYTTSLLLQPLGATASHEMPALLQRNKLPGHINLMPTPGQSLTAHGGLSALP